MRCVLDKQKINRRQNMGQRNDIQLQMLLADGT
jgi:hypothetical protein